MKRIMDNNSLHLGPITPDIASEQKIVSMPSNKHHKPIEIIPGDDFSIWSLVSHDIKKLIYE